MSEERKRNDGSDNSGFSTPLKHPYFRHLDVFIDIVETPKGNPGLFRLSVKTVKDGRMTPIKTFTGEEAYSLYKLLTEDFA